MRQRGNRQRLIAAKASPGPARGRAQQREALTQTPTALAEHRTREGDDRRSRLQVQPGAVGSAEAQRRSHQGLADIDAHAAQQRERVEIGADQDVLAVVEQHARGLDAARAAAELRRHLEQRDRMAEARRLDGRRQPGPATADDGHTLAH